MVLKIFIAALLLLWATFAIAAPMEAVSNLVARADCAATECWKDRLLGKRIGDISSGVVCVLQLALLKYVLVLTAGIRLSLGQNCRDPTELFLQTPL
jgi:hypothetical protein